MRTRILDLDGGIVQQSLLVQRSDAQILPLQEWGPQLRLACLHRSFTRFERQVAQYTGLTHDAESHLTFLGSGDFHHVSLALLRRLREPFNLLVLDNHPDWMRGIPFLHCGTWLYHAAQLPGVQHIFHLGGEVDFDNAYRGLTPWPLLRSGKIIVGPSHRRFQGRSWDQIAHRPLRHDPQEPMEPESIEDWLSPYRKELAAWPLYISLDKDVLSAEEAIVNWDSGRFTLPEVLAILRAFVNAAGGPLLGMDVVGDWSPVRLAGLLRHFMHWTEHPALTIDPRQATRRNEAVNLSILECLMPVLLAA